MSNSHNSYSKQETDGWGDPVTRHYDSDNKQTGYAKQETDGWGSPVTRHYSK